MYRRQCYDRHSCGCNACECKPCEDSGMELVPTNMFMNITDNHCEDMCECGFRDSYNGLPQNPILAQAYVPIQQMNKVFTPEMGLRMGTIFPELVRPYMPNQSMEEKAFIEAANMVKGGCNDVY